MPTSQNRDMGHPLGGGSVRCGPPVPRACANMSLMLKYLTKTRFRTALVVLGLMIIPSEVVALLSSVIPYKTIIGYAWLITVPGTILTLILAWRADRRDAGEQE